MAGTATTSGRAVWPEWWPVEGPRWRLWDMDAGAPVMDEAGETRWFRSAATALEWAERNGMYQPEPEQLDEWPPDLHGDDT